jgi:hypothetical protein
MWRFLNEKQSEYGIRISLENFAEYDKIKVVPLYATGSIMKFQPSTALPATAHQHLPT